LKILFYCLNFAPEPTGAGKYTGELAKWMVAAGHEVRAIVAPPYYPYWRVEPPYSSRGERVEEFEGIKVHRCRLYVPSSGTGLKRLIHLGSFAFSSFRVANREISRWRPDVVFCVEPTLLVSVGALIAARKAKSRTWLHRQDLEVLAAVNLGLLPGILKNVARGFERRVVRSFDMVSTISGKMQRITEQTINKPTLLLRNWTPFPTTYRSREHNKFRLQLGLSANGILCLYSGNLGRKQGLHILEATMLRISEVNPEIHLLICGAGEQKQALEKQLARFQNISFRDLVPDEDLSELLSAADIHLVIQRAEVADFVMPSKLGGIFASGKPVIATAESGTELAEVVSGRGLVIPPGDGQALADGILQLACDPKLRAMLGSKGRTFAENYMAHDAILSSFESHFIRLVNGS
jgi:colanic acid biosynthesis glycosyl transferase WcaI